MTLMSQAYGYIGWTQFWGSIFCYYIVANDFGFPPSSMQFIANSNIVIPNSSDQFNPSDPPYYGNTVLAKLDAEKDQILPGCSGFPEKMVDWIYTEHAKIDLRMAAFSCKDDKITS